MKVCGLVLSLVLLLSSTPEFTRGVVEISPSPVAAVCQEGDQLELTCTSSGAVHRWEFTVFPENVSYTTTPVSSAGTSGVPQPLTFSGSVITFLRLSGQDSSPLVSRIVVSSLSRGLNRTVVNCFEGISSIDSVATTIIRIIDPGQFDLSVRSCTEQFSSDGITVTLEWTLLNSQDYYQQFLHNISISTNPQPNNMMFTGNMRVWLELSYNTLYKVSVIQHSTCHQFNRNQILLLNYFKCSTPMELTNAIVVGYTDPALEGQNITFACPPYRTLNGSNSSTCMGNGEWEPDPREVECTGEIGTTSITTSGPVGVCNNNPLYVLRINNSTKDSIKENKCCSGFLIARTSTTTCLENGEWELETSQAQTEAAGKPNVPALISVLCVAVVTSVLMFIIGFVCGHCFSQRQRKLTQHEQTMSTSTAAASNKQEVDLELKDNVAYATLRPK